MQPKVHEMPNGSVIRYGASEAELLRSVTPPMVWTGGGRQVRGRASRRSRRQGAPVNAKD